jgi:hypothetical protein
MQVAVFLVVTEGVDRVSRTADRRVGVYTPERMILVSPVAAIEQPNIGSLGIAKQDLRVMFADGRHALLDLQQESHRRWLSSLQDFAKEHVSVYAEVDDSSGRLVTLLLPQQLSVERIGELVDGRREIDLVISHAPHYLLSASPNYTKLLGLLEAAVVSGDDILVTENLDGSEIIDVRAIGRKAPPPNRLEATRLHAGTGVTGLRADALFVAAISTACAIAHDQIQSPCIPFRYPNDGCWARAHEMCRLMLAQMTASETASLRKVWLYGHLHAATRNTQSCSIGWKNFHVAPVLDVNLGGSSTVAHVVDPALFDRVVTLATWREAIHGLGASLEFSEASAFYRSHGGGVIPDPDYSLTRQKLDYYRNQLKLHATKTEPPYAHCAV